MAAQPRTPEKKPRKPRVAPGAPRINRKTRVYDYTMFSTNKKLNFHQEGQIEIDLSDLVVAEGVRR
jgi:hypothetical protein